MPTPTTTRRSRRRRMAGALVLFTLPGAVVSTLVAWGFAVFGAYLIPEDSDYEGYVTAARGQWVVYHNVGGRRVQVYAPPPPSAKPRPWLDGYPCKETPFWAPRLLPGEEGAQRIFRGWPLACLYDETHEQRTGSFRSNSTFSKLWEVTTDRGNMDIPYGVWWPGMLVDTACYGGTLAAAWCGVRSWRRRRRWKPGTCRSCGYDRSGLADDAACPECGAGAAAGNGTTR